MVQKTKKPSLGRKGAGENHCRGTVKLETSILRVELFLPGY